MNVWWRRPEPEPEPPVSGWELHPCTVPIYRTMWSPAGKDEDSEDRVILGRPHPDGLLGNIWRCWCGRRWRVTDIRGDLGKEKLIWELVNQLDEEDFLAMERIANGEADATS